MGYFEKGKAFCNKPSNVDVKSKNYSTYYIDVDKDNKDDVDLLNLVRGMTLLNHGYAVSQASKSESKANDIGREQLSILAYQYAMPDSDYRMGRIPNTILSANDAEYVRKCSRSFLDLIYSSSSYNKWIYPKDVERYAEETAKYDYIDKRFPYLYGVKANEKWDYE